MSIELKIKSKHLALEPAIIRKEEQKLLKQLSWFRSYGMEAVLKDPAFQKMLTKHHSLRDHRITVVRNEARATHLARAYIAGIPYENVEKKRHDDVLFMVKIFPRIVSMVAKYGNTPVHPTMLKEHKQLSEAIMAWCKI